jgi:nucleoside-diphosphate-sugar epimerase
MKVLVVGGAGYVGGAVTDLLFQQRPAQHMVSVYDSLLYEESYLKPVSFYRGDVRDRGRWFPLLKWADAVIWLAAVVGDAACELDRETALDVNEYAVGWLAENFSGRIIFMSTCSVYGAADTQLDEESAVKPLSTYAVSKLMAEARLASHSNAIIFRLGTLYGLSDHFSRVRFDLVVNTLTLRAHQTGKISVFGGRQFRPLLHVRDAAEAAVAAIGQTQTGVYNLARANWSITSLARLVATEFPSLVVEHSEQKFEDNRNYQVSTDKARCELGFDPRRSVDEGIEEIKRLLDEGRLTDPSSPRYWNAQHLERTR